MSTERRTVPPEAVELYNQFIHGEISRRSFMDGMQRFAVAGVTAAAMAEALMPNYAAAQQVPHNDERIKASYVTVPSPQGNGYIRGYLVRPFSADSREEKPGKLPGVIVVHENRGLNPHTEDVARRFALANFMAFAPDVLSSVGGYPGDDYQGGLLFQKVDANKKFEDIVASALWLKARPDCTGKIGVTGFCYGGGISNQLAVRLGGELAAAAPFYGGAPPVADVAEDQGGHPRAPRCAGHAHGRNVDGLREGAEGGECPARGPHLSELRSRLLQRRDARALQPGRGDRGLDAHHRLVQQVREGLIAGSHCPRIVFPLEGHVRAGGVAFAPDRTTRGPP